MVDLSASIWTWLFPSLLCLSAIQRMVWCNELADIGPFVFVESPDMCHHPQRRISQRSVPATLPATSMPSHCSSHFPPKHLPGMTIEGRLEPGPSDQWAYSYPMIIDKYSYGDYQVRLSSDGDQGKYRADHAYYHINESLLLLHWRNQTESVAAAEASKMSQTNQPWEIKCVPSRIVDCHPVASIEWTMKNVNIVSRSPNCAADIHKRHFLAQEGTNLDSHDYELVYPVVAKDAVSEERPQSRSKRSISHWTNETDFIIQAFGKSFHFDWINRAHASSRRQILSPNFVVQRVANRTTWLDQEAIDRDGNWLDNCLRVGTVNGDVESTAVMDLCWNILHNLKKPTYTTGKHGEKFNQRGLMGAFHMKDANYLLQPAGDLFQSDGPSTTIFTLPPHIVYRTRNTITHETQGNTSLPLTTRQVPARMRKKRELDASEFAMGAWEYHVELLVVADYSMRQFHGKDLNEYILTLMSIVGMIYRDASIGNSLTITVAKLITLESDTEGPRVSWSAQETLESFCKWQASYNSQEDTDPHHHDAAILITRQDLCRVKNKCDTLGLAEIGTMCDSQKSCAIVEDSGLSSAFTIAHELGHLFNLPHDDDRSCRSLMPSTFSTYTNVMAPRLDHNSNPWTWSACSAKKLLDYLESGEASCLLDEPISNSNSIPTRKAYLTQGRSDYQLERMSVNSFLFPGEMFEVNKQCRLVFGDGAAVCPFMPVCKRLWCTTNLGNQTGCRTQHLPWADGTECSWDRWCKRGECVKKDLTRLDPVDGGWGSWSRWGRCSRTCGGGIKESFRECDSPKPLNGGKYCVGQRIRYKSCNIKDCGPDEMDFREEQCAAFNGKTMGYQGVEPSVIWTAKLYGQTSRQKCKLYCQVDRTNKFFLLKDKVIDGTSCGSDPADICVNGLCKKAGCDGKLGSQMRRDICGVCGGDNSTCRTITGTYNEQKYGYNFIVEIPEGASNIDIRQHAYEGMKDDYNYLALVNSKGTYLFNGDFVVSIFRKDVTVKNAMIDYTGSDTIVERINCTDSIGESLSLYVLTVGNLYPPDVYYSYMISVGDEYRWDSEGAWNSCNKECKGVQYRNLLCVRKIDRQVVPKGNCMGQPSPSEHSRTCNDHCLLRWDVQEDSDAQCSAKCNEQGTIRRRVRCLRETAEATQHQAETQLWYQDNLSSVDQQNSSPRIQEVDADKCTELSEPKPPEELRCIGSCRLVAWKYTAWNECSRQCGGGTQTRASICVDLSTGHHVPPYNCSFHQAPEPSQRSCNPQPCAADWTVGPWGACSTTCGVGVMQRAVKCLLRAEGTEADDSLCDPLRKPPVKIRCPEVPCPPPPISRPPPIPRPPQVAHLLYPAADQPSDSEWVTGAWTPCSQTCGSGEKYRSVGCRGRRTGEYLAHVSCAGLSKPYERENCFTKECGNWQFGEWGKCTAECDDGLGGAMQRRYVACVVNNKPIKDENECDKNAKPPTSQRCPDLPLCEVQTMMQMVDTGQPGGDPLRLVKYESFVAFPTSPLPPSSTTQTTHTPRRELTLARQAVWITGGWGKCSKSCGGGMRLRLVACQFANSRDEEEKIECDEGNKPENTSRCNEQPCPEWKFGQWGQCNQTCGTGFQRRIVQCIDARGSHMSNYQCSRSRRPPNIQRCNEHACGQDELLTLTNSLYQPSARNHQPSSTGVWQTSQWSTCSVSCGRGIRQRTVFCVNIRRKEMVADSSCTEDKPPSTEDCRIETCPKWRVSRWSQCSTDCGTGFRSREVLCARGGLSQHYQSNMIRVNESRCSSQNKPKDKRSCEVYHCGDGNFHWSVSKWSSCSVSCDTGKQTREINCIYKGNNSLVDASYCRKERAKIPPTVKVCKTSKHCSFRWITGEWSECSRTCGSGVKWRHVNCHRVDESGSTIWFPIESPYRCDTRNKPKERLLCSLGRCSDHFVWQVDPWTQCTKSCDGGISKRGVFCIHQKAQQRLRSSFCRANLKPESSKTCNQESCTQKLNALMSNRIY